MIHSKEELKNYIESDLRSLGCFPLPFTEKMMSLYLPRIWKYQVKMRKLEYYKNCCVKNKFTKLIYYFKFLRYEKYGLKLGFSIPINCFGPGLCLCHTGTIIINKNAKFGSNARIHANVNIGNYSKFGKNKTETNVPQFGNNVYIGPGAKLFGKINIGNDVAIGANAVVNKDVPDHVTVAGVPCKIINNNGSDGMIIHGDSNV